MGHSIAFHAALAELTGSLAAGLLLSQAVYWATRTKDPDGWFYKTQADWYQETGLTRTEQNKARARLRGFAFWQEHRRGAPATLHYRVDFEGLATALENQDADVTLEQVLHAYATALKQLSKVGYMRARKAQAVAEFIDYAAVLRAWGMTCGVCGQPILRPLGLKPDALAFDYIVPLGPGGSHTRQNLHPVHVACVTPKNAEETPAQLSYRKHTEFSCGKRTGCLTVSNPVLLPQTDQLSYRKQTLPYRTKITTEITTEITSSSANTRAPANAATKQLQALYCALTGNAWRAQDEEIAAAFREADPRKIELALLETLIETKQKKIHCFKYFVPRLQLWLMVELTDLSIETLLAMRRQRWQQQKSVSGVRC
ncbi:MAG: HNH endonuclease [Blastocatellia bacterium]|nr:HNH endonuclease [Blastocatellia bacterium]